VRLPGQRPRGEHRCAISAPMRDHHDDVSPHQAGRPGRPKATADTAQTRTKQRFLVVRGDYDANRRHHAITSGA